MQQKICTRCNEPKNSEKDFYRHPTTKDGLFPYCKDCHHKPKKPKPGKRKKQKRPPIDKSKNGTINWDQLKKFLKRYR